jgi:hypothetical protein
MMSRDGEHEPCHARYGRLSAPFVIAVAPRGVH